MRRVTSLVRRAIEEYDMIAENDRVAVGISGGKDSLILAAALAQISRYYPKKFEVIGLTLDMGYNSDYSKIKEFCESFGIEHKVKYTNIKEVIFDYRKESNPCSLCAKMRRGALNDFAIECGCQRVALGHHNDDVIETFMLSLLYEGRVNCFSPVTYLDRSGIYQIRPLIYTAEKDIKGIVKRHDIPVLESSCPVDGVTKREYVKTMIRQMEKETTPGLKKRMFTAIQNSGIDGWEKPDKKG